MKEKITKKEKQRWPGHTWPVYTQEGYTLLYLVFRYAAKDDQVLLLQASLSL